MLVELDPFLALTERDHWVFESLVPEDHLLVRARECIDWTRFDKRLRKYYSERHGQPSYPPLLMFKLEFLRYLYNLADRPVIQRATTDVAFRYFLNISAAFHLPDASSLCRFRGRIGPDGFHELFQELVATAREAGVVKDQLRLKDATHILANIATPTSLQLLAQIRDRLLLAAEPFDPESVAGHRVEVELQRKRTRGQDTPLQLEQRIAQLREILDWAKQIPPPAEGGPQWDWLVETLALTAKILDEQADPSLPHRTVSLVDLDARRGKHGAYYDGYTLDVVMDADSELITELNVYPAGGNEAQSAVEMVRREQAAHGNDIETLSIDGAGFNGAMLREFEDPNKGLQVEVIVPPKEEPTNDYFPPSVFVKTEDGEAVICPAGEQSQYQQRNSRDTATVFRFTRAQCDQCPLAAQCQAKPGQGHFGRTVQKNDYEAEYSRARERATTERFAEIRKRHPAIERKLNELVNHHRGRRARYWRTKKVRIQETLTCFVVNFKRLLSFEGILRAAPTAS